MRYAHSRGLRPAGRVLAIVAAASCFAISFAAAENPGKQKPGADSGAVAGGSQKPADVANPIVQLVRDPAVQRELGLAELQTAAVRGAYAKIRPRLWLLRDVSAGPGAVEKAELLASMERDLKSLLEREQLDRLQQLVARARGWPGITAEPSASRLKLSAQQIDKITAINTNTRQEIQRLASSDDSPKARDAAMQKLRTQEGTAIQKLLSSDQQQTLRQLVGAAYDLSQVRPLSYAAPDLEQVEDWVNTQPLELSRLRGRVVAFHFWAFGCINCVRNLPHYNKWHDELASDGLVVLGMHTPETQAERSVDNLRSKVDEYKIQYPVAVDHENANWAAWGNSMWPSVYLVDKSGHVRYWWYGELNWQGGNGEAFMRQRIEDLLAE